MSITPLSDILSRLSYELHALADSTEEFHHLAFDEDGPRAGPRGLDDAAFVKAAQSIDHTQQILANLSEFVGCLAMAAPEDLTLDTHQALSLITLSDLKARLVETPEAGTEPERQEAGDADIFF
ncbi:MAG: hypothetical protein H7Y08_12110 [Rhizobiaceae bacterium]|nr:hypothetical protein [Rhizobiaceae bacterium]